MPESKPQQATNYLNLDEQLCFPVYAASNLIVKAYRPLLKPLGLTYPQYLVMLVLWEQSPASVGHLCQRLYLDTGTLTPMLKRMEVAGFISRTRSQADERRVDIQLTEKGAALKEQAKSIPETLFCQLSADPNWVQGLKVDIKQLIQRITHSN